MILTIIISALISVILSILVFHLTLYISGKVVSRENEKLYSAVEKAIDEAHEANLKKIKEVAKKMEENKSQSSGSSILDKLLGKEGFGKNVKGEAINPITGQTIISNPGESIKDFIERATGSIQNSIEKNMDNSPTDEQATLSKRLFCSSFEDIPKLFDTSIHHEQVDRNQPFTVRIEKDGDGYLVSLSAFQKVQI